MGNPLLPSRVGRMAIEMRAEGPFEVPQLMPGTSAYADLHQRGIESQLCLHLTLSVSQGRLTVVCMQIKLLR